MKKGLLVTALFLLTQLAGASPNPIEFWHAFAPPYSDLIQKRVNAFNQSQTDYHVRAIYKGDYHDVLTSTVAAYRAGRPPQLVHVFEVGTQTMLSPQGIIIPVETLFKRAGLSFDLNSFFEPIRRYYSLNGVLQALPFNSSVPVLYVNQTLLKTPLPDAKILSFETLQSVLDAQTSPLRCGLTTTWPAWTQIESFLARHSALFAVPDNGFTEQPARTRFNTPALVEHVTRLLAWEKQGWFHYGGRRSDANALFTGSVCAMMIDTSGSLLSYYKQFGDALQVYGYPYWETLLSSETAGTLSSSENASHTLGPTPIGGAAIWAIEGFDATTEKGMALFLQFMLDPAFLADWHQQTGYLPITKAAYTQTRDAGYYASHPLAQRVVEQFIAQPQTPYPAGPRLPALMQIREYNDQTLEAIWSGQISPQKGLATANDVANHLIKRFTIDDTAQ